MYYVLFILLVHSGLLSPAFVVTFNPVFDDPVSVSALHPEPRASTNDFSGRLRVCPGGRGHGLLAKEIALKRGVIGSGLVTCLGRGVCG